ncbi:unnamed protein product [Camellia sinensis]
MQSFLHVQIVIGIEEIIITKAVSAEAFGVTVGQAVVISSDGDEGVVLRRDENVVWQVWAQGRFTRRRRGRGWRRWLPRLARRPRRIDNWRRRRWWLDVAIDERQCCAGLNGSAVQQNIGGRKVSDQSNHVDLAGSCKIEQNHFCMICGKGFKRDANLRMHMRGHGDEYKSPAARNVAAE